MNTINCSFFGIIPALVTPFVPDGSVNENALRKLVNVLIESGVHALNPLASTGEYAYLSDNERIEVARIVIDETAGRVPVIVGVGHTATRLAISQARAVEALGADALLAILPAYFPLTPQAIVEYFSKMASAVSCPVGLYNNPRLTGIDLTPNLIGQLAKIKNICYLKDATGLTGRLLSIMEQVDKSFCLFSASAHIPLTVLLAGGVGWMAGPACLIPRQSILLYDLACRKEWDAAMNLQRKLWPLNDLFLKYGLAACIKAGLAMQGFQVGNPRIPQTPIASKGRSELKSLLDQISLIGA